MHREPEECGTNHQRDQRDDQTALKTNHGDQHDIHRATNNHLPAHSFNGDEAIGPVTPLCTNNQAVRIIFFEVLLQDGRHCKLLASASKHPPLFVYTSKHPPLFVYNPDTDAVDLLLVYCGLRGRNCLSIFVAVELLLIYRGLRGRNYLSISVAVGLLLDYLELIGRNWLPICFDLKCYRLCQAPVHPLEALLQIIALKNIQLYPTQQEGQDK